MKAISHQTIYRHDSLTKDSPFSKIMKDIQIDLYVLCYDNLYINQIDTIHNIIYLAVILEK